MKIFVSYCWKQQEWLKRNLIPLLEAGGHEVLVDFRHFTAGPPLAGQMDKLQDSADKQLLLLSKDYLLSDNCQHEMDRAIKLVGPGQDKVVFACYESLVMPEAIKSLNPLWVGCLKDQDQNNWELLGRSFGIDLGVTPDRWIRARKKIRDKMMDGNSVNLVVAMKMRWQELITSLESDPELNLKRLDFDAGYTGEITFLTQEILSLAGITCKRPTSGAALAVLSRNMETLVNPSRQSWLHFSHVIQRAQGENGRGIFNREFFAAVRHLANNQKLHLLIHSRQPVGEFLEKSHELSHIDWVTVDL